MTTNRWLAIGVVFILCIFGEAVGSHEKSSWYDAIPGFWGIFGFVGCIVLIAVAKGLGLLFIQRKEGYYKDV